MNKQDFIQTLYTKRSTFSDPDQAEMMANLLETISSDIYSEGQRFIFELIQNADDASYKDGNEIHFDFYSNYLIVSHKGKPFDETDIKAITNAGKGTKNSDLTKTGYKGIGFKSVFGKSNNVIISSDGYKFRFDRSFIKTAFKNTKMPWQIIPIWTTENDILSNSNFNLTQDHFNVSAIIEIGNTGNLQIELDELMRNGRILLFLRRISKISVSLNGTFEYSIEKRLTSKGKFYDEVELLKNENILSTWLVTLFDNIPIDEKTQISLLQDEQTPDKLKTAKITDISFAARIENCRIKPLIGEESLIFTYLPTSVIDFKFPFILNASFLTTASRQGIHSDRLWNKWLFQLVGKKIFDWLIIISESKYKYQVLNLLPSEFRSNHNEIKKAFDNSFEKFGKLKSFVPNRKHKLITAPKVLIDKTGLSEEDFISTNVLIEYINAKQNKNLKADSIIHPNLEFKERLNSLGAYTFELENLEDFFLDCRSRTY